MEDLRIIADPVARRRYIIFFHLPKNIQETITSLDTAEKIRQIEKKYKLPDLAVQQLALTTGLILLGETRITDFTKTIQEKCKLDEELTHQLAQEVNQAIFLPVKENLKKVHRINQWPGEAEGQVKSNIPKPSPASPIQSEPTSRPTPSSSTSPPEPRIKGNIVDLKGENEDANRRIY